MRSGDEFIVENKGVVSLTRDDDNRDSDIILTLQSPQDLVLSVDDAGDAIRLVATEGKKSGQVKRVIPNTTRREKPTIPSPKIGSILSRSRV